MNILRSQGRSSTLLPGNHLSKRTVLLAAILIGIVGICALLLSRAATPNGVKGDINGDNTVTITDLSILLSNFGKAASAATTPHADINSDGTVNITDLSILLTNFGKTGTVTPPPTPSPSTPVGQAGMVVDLTWGVPTADADRTYQILPQSGSKWVRLGVGWNGTETSRGVYNQTRLANYDAVVAKARAAGQRVLFMIQDTPAWANGGQDVNTPPTNPNDIAPFMKMMAERYYPKGVEAFEVWNEPGTSRFWKPSPNPAQYASLLKASYPAIKAGAPNMIVVTGGTSGNDYNFWTAAYNAGIHGNFDVMGLHPYTGKGDPSVTWNSNGHIDEWAFTGYRSIHDLMVSKGDNKPIWFTEFGWATATDGSWAAVTSQQQAAYLTKAFQIMRQDSYVGVAFWYNLRNNFWANDANTSEDQFGLFTTKWAPKPSWEAYKAAANQ